MPFVSAIESPEQKAEKTNETYRKLIQANNLD